jgi:hypothetical protein
MKKCTMTIKLQIQREQETPKPINDEDKIPDFRYKIGVFVPEFGYGSQRFSQHKEGEHPHAPTQGCQWRPVGHTRPAQQIASVSMPSLSGDLGLLGRFQLKTHFLGLSSSSPLSLLLLEPIACVGALALPEAQVTLPQCRHLYNWDLHHQN